MKSKNWLCLVVLAIVGCAPEPAPQDGAVDQLLDLPRMVLVTGATGRQGGAVARELLERGYQVRALTRNAQSEKAKQLVELGAEVLEGDFGDRASLDLAVFGVYGVFSVQPAGSEEAEQGKALADAAKAAGVTHFIYSSSAAADPNSRHVGSPKLEIDAHIRDIDLPYTIFRPVSFFENFAGRQAEIAAQGVRDPRPPERRSQHISVTDIAFFVAEAFDNPSAWLGQSKNIAAQELTQQELTDTFAMVMGVPVEYRQVTWEQFAEMLPPRLVTLYRWLDEGEGYPVDAAALKSEYPDLLTFEEYLRTAGWQDWQPPEENE